MMSVLLQVFLLQLFLFCINQLFKPYIKDLAWLIFTKLPTEQSKKAGDLSNLRREVVRLHREMKATSAQDEFAKWAKLRRQHDKAKEKYDQQSRANQSFKSNFDRSLTALQFLGSQALNFGCTMYYAKEPMFWLPQGWVPYPVEWVLSLTRAPLGCVSVNVWSFACASVIAMVSEAVMAMWTLRAGEVKEGPRKGEKIKMESVGGTGGGGAGEKKEL